MIAAPTHHLDDDVLLTYVAGTATEPVALIVACHLTLCALCRTRAQAAETVGGAILDAAPAADLSENALERMLARLDESPTDAPPVANAPFEFAGIPLPRPLAHYLLPDQGGHHQAPPDFRFLAPGIRGIDLPVKADAVVRTRLLRLAPGVAIPRHTHAAPEFTLVFSGGISDGGAHYVRGDVRFRDTDDEHVQVVDADGPCIALVLNEGALVPKTWGGRVLSFLFDR